MTVNTTSITSGPYTGNGVTTSFPYTFKAFTDENVIVYQTVGGIQYTRVLGTHYSVTGTGIDGGGNVVMVTAPAPGDEIYIRSNYSAEQLTDFDSQGGFYPDTHEDAFDKQTMLIQQLEDIQGRGLRLPLGDSNGVMPELTPDPLRLLRWNAAGDAIENVTVATIDPDAIDTGLVIQSIDLFATLATTAATTSGMVVYIKQHTSGGLGGGYFQDTAGTITNNGGTIINNTVTAGRHWKRIGFSDLDITMFGALLDGVTSDDTAWENGISAASIKSEALFVPASLLGTKITSTKNIDQNVPILGRSGGNVTSQYLGRQGGQSRILFTGSGACFQVNPNAAPSTTIRLPYGQQFKNLVIQNATGNTSSTHGIKVSDAANINVAGMDMAGLNIEDVFIYGFKNGRALEVNYCFNNKITNLVSQTCGVCVSLNYAHGTVFSGGSFEQSLVGLDTINSFDVSIYGTVMQGIDVSRIASQGLSVPSDFFVWTGGWNGSGADSITRTAASDYAGVGCRVYGSMVRWFGGYEEGNTVGYITELGSDLSLYGKYVDLDAPVTYWIQVGIGSLTIDSPCFAQGSFANLVGVIHTERNYASPVAVTRPTFLTSTPLGKRYTGFTTANAGQLDTWDPAAFRYTRKFYNSDIEVNGGIITHGGYRASSGYNREFVETLTPASTGTVTKDLSSGSVGTNFLHLANSANVTFTFTDTARAVAGTPMRLMVINTGGSSTTCTFSSAYFRAAASPYTIGANQQRIFEFFYLNGFWAETGAAVAL